MNSRRRKGDYVDDRVSPHKPVLLVGGRAKHAQVYPKKFCQRICQAIAAQKHADELGVIRTPLTSLEEFSEMVREHNAENEGPMDALH